MSSSRGTSWVQGLLVVILLGLYSTGPLTHGKPEPGPKSDTVGTGSTAPETGYYPQNLWILQSGAVTRIDADSGESLQVLDSKNASALALSPADGTLWYADKKGIQSNDLDGKSVLDSPISLLASERIAGLAIDDQRGVLWASSESGLHRFAVDGSFLGTVSIPDISAGPILVRATGDAWLLADGWLYRVSATGSVLGRSRPNAIKDASLIRAAHGGNGFWLAGRREVAAYAGDGRVIAGPWTHSLKQPQHLDGDGEGGVWLTDNHEIVHLDANGYIALTTRPTKDGLVRKDGRLTSLAVDRRDGSIWFGLNHSVHKLSANGAVVNSLDTARRYGAIHAGALHIDDTPPEIWITAPEAEIYTNDNTPEIAVSYMDYGSRISTDFLAFELNDSVLEVNCSQQTETDAVCLPIAPMEDGYHEVSATIEDIAGNISEPDSVRFTVDTIPPEISIESPSHELITNQPHLMVRGSVNEFSTVSINGEKVPLTSDYRFNHTVSLKEGVNTIHLSASDRAGNQAELSRTVTLDTIPPKISLKSPAEGLVTDEVVVLIAGSINEPVVLQLNGTDVPLTQEYAFNKDSEVHEGITGFTLTAEDLAGNMTTVYREVIRDTTPPVIPDGDLITISEPDEEGYITITGAAGSVEPGSIVTLVIGGDGSFSVQGGDADPANHFPGHQTYTAIADRFGGFTIRYLLEPQMGDIRLYLRDQLGRLGDGLDLSDRVDDAQNETLDANSTGTVKGHAQVNGGSALYKIPITVPPGRADMQPELALVYSSRGGNGVIGMGWKIAGTSGISRCGPTVAQDGISLPVTYTSRDRLCLDGERLVLINGRYGKSGSEYRTEIERFARVTLNGDINSETSSFLVEYKDGRKARYGYDASRQTTNTVHSAENHTEPFGWAMHRIEDRSGNSIHYDYKKNGPGEFLLSAVSYTGRNNVKGTRTVRFHYGKRPDRMSGFGHGGQRTSSMRLRMIETRVENMQIRSYHLNYGAVSAATGRSILRSIQECALLEGERYCLPETTFEWQSKAPRNKAERLDLDGLIPLPEPGTAPFSPNKRTLRIVSDYDGDGRRELFYSVSGVNAPKLVFFGADKEIKRTIDITSEFEGLNVGQSHDFNNDGRADIVDHDDDWNIRFHSWSGSAFKTETFPIKKTRNYAVEGSIHFQDFDNDGDIDVLQMEETSTDSDDWRLYFYENIGNPATPSFSGTRREIYNLPETSVTFTNGNTVVSPAVSKRAVDIDGDGILDVMLEHRNKALMPYLDKVLLGRINSNGKFYFVESSMKSMNIHEGLGQSALYFFTDVNGDGLDDFLFVKDKSGVGKTWHLRLNHGGQFGEIHATNVTDGLACGYDALRCRDSYTAKYKGSMFPADWDNDGAQELLIIDPTRRVTTYCLRAFRDQQMPGEIRHYDICGDSLYGGANAGSIDRSLYKFKSLEFVFDSESGLRARIKNTDIVAQANFTSIGDVFGDGLTDIFFYSGGVFKNDYFKSGCGDACQSYGGIYVHEIQAQAPDLLVGIKDGLGSVKKWRYHALSQSADRKASETSFYEVPESFADRQLDSHHYYFVSSMHVVSSFHQSHGGEISTCADRPSRYRAACRNGLTTVQYGYREAIYNNKGRGFRGFRTIVEENFDRGLRRTLQFHQEFPLSGRLKQVQTQLLSATASDRVLERTTMAWNVDRPFEGKTRWPNIRHRSRIANDHQHGYAQIYSIDTIFEHDTTNGCVQRSSRTTDDAYGTYVVDTVNANSSDSSAWWLCRLDKQTVTSTTTHKIGPFPTTGANDTQVNISSYVYNNRRQVKREVRQVAEGGSIDQALSITIERGYSNASGSADFGNLTSITTKGGSGITAIKPRTTRMTYGKDGYFVESTVNPKGHSTAATYNAAHGQPLTATDPNGVTTRFGYDAFGRKTSEQLADFPSTVTEYRDCGKCVSGGRYQTVVRQNGSPTVVTTYDLQNRALRADTQGFESSQWVRVETRYDRLGRKISQTEPHFSDDNIVPTTRFHEYDVLDRLLSSTDAKGIASSYTYTGLEVIAHINPPDSPAYDQAQVKNALGQLVETRDAAGSVTHFRYGSVGEPVLIQDAADNRIETRYNGLGQKVRINDPDMGEWVYTYDVAGNLVRQVDAKDQITEHDYDVLDRPVERREPEGITNWIWDTAKHGVGQLYQVEQYDGYVERYSYDSLGRVASKRTVVDGIAYDVDTDYDRFNRVSSLTYPDIRRVSDTPPQLPGVPTNVSASTPDQRGRHVVSWKAATDGGTPDTYNISVSKDAGKFVSAGTVSAPSTKYTVPSASNGEYAYKVSACNPLGCSADSAASNTVSVSLPPQLSATPFLSTNGSYRIEWQMPADSAPFDSFKLYERITPIFESEPGDWRLLTTLDASARSRFFSNRPDGLYEYKIRSCSQDKCGTESNKVSVLVSREDAGGGCDYDSDPPICWDPQFASEPESVETNTESLSSGHRLTVRYAYTSRGYLKELVSGDGSRVYWKADAMDARLNVAMETFGNGLSTTRTFEKASGYLKRISTVASSGMTIQALNYDWSALGNLKARHDSLRGFNEQFTYDLLNRLETVTLSAGSVSATTLSMSYDILGNVTAKNSLIYAYDENPHAVTSISGGTVSRGFQYDANGNMIERDGDAIDWSSANLPEHIRSNGETAEFAYASSRQRYRQISSYSGSTEETVYIGKHFEEVTKGTDREFRHSLYVGERNVALVTRKPSTADKVRYLHGDHLGGINTITDSSGNVVAGMSFDAHGNRREISDWKNTLDWSNGTLDSIVRELRSETHRGFTGHEMLDNVSLVHMNGRVYDPTIGRFLSVDPVFQFPENTQSLNPYSYVLNNPLSYNDPTGYCGGNIHNGNIAGDICSDTSEIEAPGLEEFEASDSEEDELSSSTGFRIDSSPVNNGAVQRESESDKRDDAESKGEPSNTGGISEQDYLSNLNEIWKNTPISDGFNNNEDVERVGDEINSRPEKYSHDIAMTPEQRRFIDRIARPTFDVQERLNRKGPDTEFFIQIGQGAEGQFMILATARVPLGGEFSLHRDATLVAHWHFVEQEREPGRGDHSPPKFGGIPNATITPNRRDRCCYMYEVGRQNGEYVYRSIRGENVGDWRRNEEWR